MARSINQVIIMGNLTRDPEMRTTPTGQNVTSFSLALNRSYKDANGEWQDAADYIDVVAWAQLGERVNQYLSKGRRAIVQGRLSQRSWEQEGQKRSKVEVIANDVTFLDGAGSGDDAGGQGGHSGGSASGSSASSAPKKKKEDVVIENIDDKPIDLSEIPF